MNSTTIQPVFPHDNKPSGLRAVSHEGDLPGENPTPFQRVSSCSLFSMGLSVCVCVCVVRRGASVQADRWCVLMWMLTGSRVSLLSVLITETTAALRINWDPEEFCVMKGGGEEEIKKRNIYDGEKVCV